MSSSKHRTFSYIISPRPIALAGGWELQLLEDGELVSRSVFPLPEMTEALRTAAVQAAFSQALTEAAAWLKSCGRKDGT